MAPRHPTRGESGSHIVTMARGVGDLVKSGLVMFGLAWWMFAAGSVAACSCASLTDDEALAEADVAFVGTLQEIRVPDDVVTWSSDDPARFVFAVSAVYKGEAFEQQSVVTSRDGASCGLEVQRWPDSVGVRADRRARPGGGGGRLEPLLGDSFARRGDPRQFRCSQCARTWIVGDRERRPMVARCRYMDRRSDRDRRNRPRRRRNRSRTSGASRLTARPPGRVHGNVAEGGT